MIFSCPKLGPLLVRAGFSNMMDLQLDVHKEIRLPPTPKGKHTRTLLLNHAHTLFKEKGFYASEKRNPDSSRFP